MEFVHQQMKKENIAYILNNTLQLLNKERNTVISNTVDEPGGYHVK